MSKVTKDHSKAAKIINIISMVILTLCAVVLVYSTISFAKTGLVKFFNCSFHAIQTQSMEPDIKKGDLVIVKDVPFEEIKVGDDILFKCEDKDSAVYGKYIVHRVKEITEEPGVYKTYGINNKGIEDKVLSRAEGKVVMVSSALGAIFSFLTNWKGIIIVVAIIILILFTILQVFSVISNASKYKEAKDQEKLKNNTELKEQLRQELLAELKQEQNEASAGIEEESKQKELKEQQDTLQTTEEGSGDK